MCCRICIKSNNIPSIPYNIWSFYYTCFISYSIIPNLRYTTSCWSISHRISTILIKITCKCLSWFKELCIISSRCCYIFLSIPWPLIIMIILRSTPSKCSPSNNINIWRSNRTIRIIIIHSTFLFYRSPITRSCCIKSNC